jgi:hypothetical protein
VPYHTNIHPAHQAFCLHLTEVVQTTENAFGLSQIYYGRPAQVPNSLDESAAAAPLHSRASQACAPSLHDSLWPYPNISAWCLGDWFWNGGDTKSKTGLKSLVNMVLLAHDFVLGDLIGVLWDTIDANMALGQSSPFTGQCWTKSSVWIHVPLGVNQSKKAKKKAAKARRAPLEAGHTSSASTSSQWFTVNGIW